MSSKTRIRGRLAVAWSSLRTAQNVPSGSAGASDQPRAPETRSTMTAASSSPSTQLREPGLDLVRAPGVGDADQCRHHLAQRPERQSLAVGEAAARRDRRALAHRLGELVREPRLADAGRAEDRDELAAAPADRSLERRGELPQLVLASDQRGREPPVAEPGAFSTPTSLNAGTRPLFPLSSSGGTGSALTACLTSSSVRSPIRISPRGAACSSRAARLTASPLTKPWPRDGIADDHLSGVDAGPRLEGDAVAAAELLVELGQRAAHVVRRTHRAQRVVLAHRRHAEDGHHRIADELLDDAPRGARARRSPSGSTARSPASASRDRALPRVWSSRTGRRRRWSRPCARPAAAWRRQARTRTPSRTAPRPASPHRSSDMYSRPESKRMMGLEPTTFCMASRRSSQLSYIRATGRV